MKLYDEYNVKDVGYTPKGIVKLYDNDGNVIFERHNLVVNTGRELMYALFLKYFRFSSNTTSINNIMNAISPKLNIYLAYDSDNTQTMADTELENVAGGAYYKQPINNQDQITLDELTRSIIFNVSFTVNDNFFYNSVENNTQEESFNFNQIYITYNLGDDVEKLFSRVAMDPVFMKNGMKYQLEYALYF